MSGRIETFTSDAESSKWSKNKDINVVEAGVDIGDGTSGGGSDVEVDQVITEGREVAGITVDGERTAILIPNAGEWTQSDWAESDPSDDAYIKNKPDLATVATSGDYTDLSNTPDLSDFVEDANYVHTDYNYDLGAKNVVDGVSDALAGKVDKVQGKALSDNNYSNADKTKLTNLASVYGIGTNLTLDPQTNILSADAQPITIDSAMSTTSENAVQNKVITAALDDKVDKVQGKVLSDNNYTTAEKDKLAGIDNGAEVNDISTISVNGVNVPADVNKNVNLQISSGTVIFGTTDPNPNIGSDNDRYVKVSTTDFGKSFRIHTTSVSTTAASINIDTIENGVVVSTDEVIYTNPNRTYSDFTVTYSGQWIIRITTDNVYGYETGDTIIWQFYEQKDVTLVIDPPEVYAEYLKSSGIWVKLYDKDDIPAANTFDADDFTVTNNEVSIIPAQRIFTGTQAQWNALTLAEKKSYGQANITDDGNGGGAISTGAELLWQGSFSGEGTINVPNLSQYLVIAIQNNVSVLIIGNNFTGSGALGLYDQASFYTFAYRFDNSVTNQLTVNRYNRGIIYNGNTTYGEGEWCTITKIYGLVKKGTGV